MQNVYLVDGARTAFTSFGGSFASTDVTKLGTVTAVEALKRAGVSPENVGHVIYGNVIHSSTNAAYLARHIGLEAGVPKEVPALTLNRLCGSGAQAVVSAAQTIMLDEADIVLAGGAENMSMAPYSNFNQRFNAPKMGSLEFEDMLAATLLDRYTGSGMGMTAEKLAEQYGITREEQDAFAAESHRRAAKAAKDGIFAGEIVGVEVKTRKGTVIIDKDEHIKPETDAESLAKLRAAFKNDGTVTAGNASGINDGAASVVVAGERAIERQNLKPLARIVSWGITGVDPSIMGIGPVPAIRQALERSELSLDDIDLIEVNEAFAAQYLSVERELGLKGDIVNMNGGAIALGHPVGTSGTRLLLSAARQLQKRNGKYAIASLCIGGGQGIAVVIERA
ncbi:acetyl-CoA C-acetyltransferase [Planococcus lenghuensis]|uniref:acetyl-CoA C-acetyltransferase n=1 Tax=Planococcus lenghuensis TaxID=2213202 RepID=A0A1Q2L3U9_9BACL|nr:acetyl-CoA C-acetyltransferase [Planococcus lenghuensis]AQQ54727.1 beta-ketoadipyl CoA thiolase [Planococcus lenghuensis]